MERAAVQKEALALEPADRADLVDSLLASLDSDAIKAVENAWAQEAEDRLRAYRAGKIEALSGPAVISELKSRYKE